MKKKLILIIVFNLYLVFNEERFMFKYTDWKKIFNYKPYYNYSGCNHYMHKKCYNIMTKNRIKFCPICRRKINSMYNFYSLHEINQKYIEVIKKDELFKIIKITNIFELLMYYNSNKNTKIYNNELNDICSIFIGSVEGIEISMREKTGIKDSAFLCLDGNKLDIKVYLL